MYLIDANIELEVLYKRSMWKESYKLLNAIKRGEISAYMLHFTIHGISAILGAPSLVAKFLSEIQTWKGLIIVDLPVDEELAAAKTAESLGLDFDDGLHYYYAKKKQIPIASFDKDYDNTDIERQESNQIQSLENKQTKD